MIDHLNHQEARRVVTIEDPIESLYRDDRCVITQRELGTDTRSFATAARQALRQDPDVLLVGEVRDAEAVAGCPAPAAELTLATTAIRNLIREGKTHQMGSVIQTGAQIGMQTLDVSLRDLVRRGTVRMETAEEFAAAPDTLRAGGSG